MSEKRKKRSRRYTMDSNAERELANFIYGVSSTLKETRVDTFLISILMRKE